MGTFFSREEVEAAVAPTPPGDKMMPPEAGYEEAETIAQLTGARHGLSPRALPRTRPRPAPPFSRNRVICLLLGTPNFPHRAHWRVALLKGPRPRPLVALACTFVQLRYTSPASPCI